MKTIRASIQCLIALAALTLWVSFAADIDGKWTGQVRGAARPADPDPDAESVGHDADGQLSGRPRRTSGDFERNNRRRQCFLSRWFVNSEETKLLRNTRAQFREAS